MSDCALKMEAACRSCAQPLTLEEMHYYDHGDGTATCNDCEAKWMEAIAKWRVSDDDESMPERP